MIWNVQLQKRLRQAGHTFELDVRFASTARRVVVIGPSGAGKTLTQKMITGIVTPDAGRVEVAGRVLFDSATRVALSPQQRQLATVFQDYALFPHLTVRQNIAFARRRGWRNPARDASDEQVERWIAAFQLEAVAGHYPHQISGGQRQRTALARALVTEPTALLLDEPFAALDPSLRTRLREELQALLAQLALPLLLITHDQDDVAAFAEHVVQLQQGHVIEETAHATAA